MTILLTTENYPDFETPAYDANWISIFFFLICTSVVVFFLSSILLSIVFDNYKRQIDESHKRKLEQRVQYIGMFYDMFDTEELGYLNYKQARDFFQKVLNLNFMKRKHRKTVVKIIKICDPEHNKFVIKERIIDFFAISGFKIIAQLDNE